MKEELTKGEQFIYDWQYGYSGSFYKSLQEAMSKADSKNTGKLKLGFPEEVEAMWNFQNTAGWWEAIEEKAQV